MTTTTEYTTHIDGSGVDLRTGLGERFAIGEDELREGGWEYRPVCERGHCDEGECPACVYCSGEEVPGVLVVLERWHNDNHAGVYRFCYEEPCRALRGDTHS